MINTADAINQSRICFVRELSDVTCLVDVANAGV